MQNLRYNLIHIAALVFFAYSFAFAVNSAVRKAFSPSAPVTFSTSETFTQKKSKRTVDVNSIVNSNFFKLAAADEGPDAAPQQDTSDLILLGTIAGNPSYSRALIKKKSENDSKVYLLKSDVFGMKLVRIEDTFVMLKSGERVQKLSLIEKKDPGAPQQPDQQSGNRIKKVLSKSEFQQKIQNNMDTMLQGLRAGPNVVNGKIDGYKLFALSNDNFLYTIGARGGDVIKRINGHPIDSTETLYKIWSNLNKESRVLLDIDRGGKTVTFDYTFNE
jgi:general secretion pathway protein C